MYFPSKITGEIFFFLIFFIYLCIKKQDINYIKFKIIFFVNYRTIFMSNTKFSVNIDAEAVKNQYEEEQVSPIYVKKTKFDTKNYLQARLLPNEKSKTLTIRLLPFSPEGGSPFKKVSMHTVKVNKEISSNGWKTFVCPIHNKKDGKLMGDKCPFCETSEKARELKNESNDEATRKKYNEIEFLNHSRDMWIVRCIERGHEEDGVKFWLFNSSKKKDGAYDKIINIANQRAASAARKGNNYSIFDLNNGMDLIITLTKTSDGKTNVQVLDEGMPSPLTEDYDEGMRWINDQKKWYEVYTVKPYEYMSIIIQGGIPVYDKEKGMFVDKLQKEKEEKEAEQERLEEELVKPTIDFSEVASGNIPIVDGNKVGNVDNNHDDCLF